MKKFIVPVLLLCAVLFSGFLFWDSIPQEERRLVPLTILGTSYVIAYSMLIFWSVAFAWAGTGYPRKLQDYVDEGQILKIKAISTSRRDARASC